MNLVVHFSPEERAYTGVELRPHFLLTEMGLRGSAIGAFIGPCTVKTEHLVDWEDRLAGDFIQAGAMVHLIGEFFGMSLREGILLQRLIISALGESLNNEILRNGKPCRLVLREGDDLFWDHRKLSVSIVTASPVSQLLHIGLNIDPAGAPVPAVGIRELGIEPKSWTQGVLSRIAEEWKSIDWACAKVRPVV